VSPALALWHVRFLVAASLAVLAMIGLVLFARDYTIPPDAERVYPYADEVGVEPNTAVTIHFSKALSPESVSGNMVLRDEQGRVISTKVIYDVASQAATMQSAAKLREGVTYTVTLAAGRQGLRDRYNHGLSAPKTWNFTVGISPPASVQEGPGGPLLLVTSKTIGFSQYYAEVLRSEGLNFFTVADIENVSASELSKYNIALIGEIPVDASHIRLFTDWVKAGGNLIAMRPSPPLAASLGWYLAVTASGGPIQHNGYLKLNPKVPAAAGLLQRPMQWHGDAYRYDSNATTIASLYRDDKTATQYPAVSTLQIGKGSATVFSYDLARSVVYTRQGNPDWSGIERDGMRPIRSDDLFYGASASDPQLDWVDPSLIAVPQADIQQRLLANLILLASAANKPLPRFWYLPRGLKAVIVLTGDDHGHGGTTRRFARYERDSAPNCSVDHWECIRSTSNIFEGSITAEQAYYFVSKGFEVDLHVYTACTDWPTKLEKNNAGVELRQMDRGFVDSLYTQQLKGFEAKYPGLPPPVSNRTDCITWGDYDTQPQVELAHNIRLDTNYYYWPAIWVQDKPGLFTGSALPMRFATRQGELIDVYQAPTQMTDESGQSYPFTVNTLLDNALGESEYLGVFTANMHNDEAKSASAEEIIASAKKRQVPIITAAQLLKWLDGRNASKFRDIQWSGQQVCFMIESGIGAHGLEVLLPSTVAAEEVASLRRNGQPVTIRGMSFAGVHYVVFPAAHGRYCATYGTR